MLRLTLSINSDYFPKHHQSAGSSSGHVLCPVLRYEMKFYSVKSEWEIFKIPVPTCFSTGNLSVIHLCIS
jgi:hypothetical protein